MPTSVLIVSVVTSRPEQSFNLAILESNCYIPTSAWHLEMKASWSTIMDIYLTKRSRTSNFAVWPQFCSLLSLPFYNLDGTKARTPPIERDYQMFRL